MLNRRNCIALAGMILFIPFASIAQSYVESALIFGRTQPGGSARIQGIGGAQIALGGDYSAALSNPAGLGMFNRSEFTFTPGVSSYSTTSNYLGNTDKDGKTILNIPGISLVIHNAKNKTGLISGSFGISMTRVNDFQGAATFHGLNTETSIIDSYMDIANGSTTAQFDEIGGAQYNTPTGLAYFNYLIGPESIRDNSNPDNNKIYFTDVLTIPDQHVVLDTKGATNQWSISYGGNYNDIIFFGGGLGLTSLRYNSQRVYDESFPITDTVFNSLSITENLKIKGTGINATIGLIVRPTSFLQIGTSFTSPTLYSLSESYDASINTSWKSYDYYKDGSTILNEEAASTDIVQSEYELTTPLKFSAGIALISKFGFITGDIELTNPAQTKYSYDANGSSSGISYTQENSEIKSTYKSTLNYRIGAEYRYEIYRFRGGFGHQANPYQSYSDIDNSITTISGGVGIRKPRYYIDLALVNSSGKPVYNQPYSLSDGYGPIAKMKSNTFTAMITVGLTF